MVWKDVQQSWSPKRLSVTVLALMAGGAELQLPGGTTVGTLLLAELETRV